MRCLLYRLSEQFSFHNTSNRRSLLLLVFGGALLLRLLLAYTTHGFSNDIACFAAWADRIFTLGPGQFYSAEMFTDYPPGFMYVLYLIGALRSLLQIPYYSDLHILLLKLPAILCDIACGFLLYREAVKRLHFPICRESLLPLRICSNRRSF